MAFIWWQTIAVAVICLLSSTRHRAMGSDEADLTSPVPDSTAHTKLTLTLTESGSTGTAVADEHQLPGTVDGSERETSLPPGCVPTRVRSPQALPGFTQTSSRSLERDSIAESQVEGNTDMLPRSKEMGSLIHRDGSSSNLELSAYPSILTSGQSLDNGTDDDALSQYNRLGEGSGDLSVEEPTTSSPRPHNDDLMDEKLSFTCKGKCGLRISFPCGCSAACVVYGRCCEHMARDCPHVLEEGHSKFRHLLTSQFFCDEDSVLKITSCPLQTEEPKALPESVLREVSEVITHHGNTSNETTAEKLHKAMWLSAPVTEKIYGFTFINKSILDCHITHTRFFTWELVLEYKYQTPLSLDDFEPLLERKNKYEPRFLATPLLSHLCARKVVRTCKNSTDSDLGSYFREKCHESSISLVRNSFNVVYPVYYANRFCAFCNEGMHTDLQLHQTNRFYHTVRALLTKVFVSGNNEYSFKGVSSLALQQPLSWFVVKCRTSEVSPARGQWSEPVSSVPEEQSVCDVICSGETFTLSHDGMCKARHTSFVALADDGLPPLCDAAFPQLAEFFTCGIKHMLPNQQHVDFHPTTVSVQFDTRANKILYLLKLQIDRPTPEATNITEVLNNFPVFAFLSNTFQKFRISEKICSGRDKENNNVESYAKTVSTMPLSRLHVSEDPHIPLEWFQDSPESERQNKTTICASLSTLTTDDGRIPSLHLLCSDNILLDDDVEMITAFNRSGCWDVLTNFKTSNGGPGRSTHRSKQSLWLRYLVLTFLLLYKNLR
ncbi:hypothetical protein EGW08_010061 [Elysia chlorotica]|uniref:SMB domain-containing protein n=1 Tax=Elysia chlorotica TaxID=188477 RepID=A0A433TKQ6_ELYCH|nr:hypothetical protein EGW08_010061 [Elysia chlorotica]